MSGKGTEQGLCFIVGTVLIMFSCAVLAGYKEDLAEKQEMDNDFSEIAAYSARLTDFQLLKTCKRGGSVAYITKHCVHEIIGGHICCWCGLTISELNLHGVWKP